MVNKKSFRFLRNLSYCIKHPIRYVSTFFSNSSLRASPIYCIMCGYNEHDNIENAIEGILGIADHLIFVDKNGRMADAVLQYNHEIPITYYVKPRMNLVESRSFAISKIPINVWILVVDADEIMLVTRSYLEQLMDRKACYRTKMTVIHTAFEGTYTMNDFHPFLMYNDNGVFFSPPKDLPRYAGRNINLPIICKENRSWSKNKRHLYYRSLYWKKWQFSNYSNRPIEEFIIYLDGKIPSDEVIKTWYAGIVQKGKLV